MNKTGKQDLLALAQYEVQQALGYEQDTLSTKREAALNYYNGIMPAAPESRSQLVSFDVADTVNSLMSQVGRIFSTSNIMFESESEEDEPASRLESDSCEWQFNKSDGHRVLHEAAHDALLIGNGWLKVTVEEKKEESTEEYPELDELQVAVIGEPTAENQEVIVTENTKTGGYRVRRITSTYKLKVECIDPSVMLFSNHRNQFVLADLRMVGERKLFTVSDLIEMGLTKNKAMSIPDSNDDNWNASRARDGVYADDSTDGQAGETAEHLKECFDICLRVDKGNGVTELRHILYGGSVLITDEPALCIPYATGSPLPMPHRVQGQGMYEQMRGVQDAKTDVLRSYADNLEVMNTSRVGAVEGDVNMSDLTNGRINGVVRMKTANGLVPLPGTDAGQQAITGLNYLDTVRSQRGGAMVDNNDADKQLMMSSATAAAGAMESAERMAGYYANNLVQSLLKGTYLLIHKKMRLELPGTIGAKLRGKWQQIKPSEWKERLHTEITAGMTSMERKNKIQSLTLIISKMEEMILQGGEGIITDKNKLYSAYDDFVRAAEMGDASDYLLDPGSEESKAAMKSASEQADKQAQEAKQLQQAMLQITKQIEDQKVEFDRYKVDAELKFKYYDTNLDAEVSEAKITADSVIKLETSRNKDNA